MAPYTVQIHPYESAKVRHACAYEIGPSSATGALVFIGGLTDGPQTIPVVRYLAKKLEEAEGLSYSIFEFRMRSSFIGFGTSSLANDVADTSDLVKYLRSIGKKKIVLIGGSTGCQDCLEYTNHTKHNNEPVDGYILQGPISDRECLPLIMEDPEPGIELAKKLIAEGKGDHLMPIDMVPQLLEAPFSAYRWWSLAAKGGDDDYFSTDLDEETFSKIWSRVDKPTLVLHSEDDEYAPAEIDQEEMNKRYQAASSLVSPLSGLIPNANHTVDDPEAQEWMANRVIEFLKTLKN